MYCARYLTNEDFEFRDQIVLSLKMKLAQSIDVCQALPLLELFIYLTREKPDVDYLCGPIKRILRSENKEA